jgi:hypothetical protein
MQLVRFNRSMAPHVAGEERAVTEEEAARLVAEGVAEAVPSVFDRAREEEARKPRLLPNLKRKPR